MYKQELLSLITKYSRQYPIIKEDLAEIKSKLDNINDENEMWEIASEAWPRLRKKALGIL